jgi:hypothetical protein
MSAYIERTKKDLKQHNATSQNPRKAIASKTQNKQKERNNKKKRAKINAVETKKTV